MADSTEAAWWARRGEPPLAGGDDAVDERAHGPRPKARALLIVSILAAAVLLVALLGGVFGGSGPPNSGPAAPSASQAWSGADGARVHAAYLASCQSNGGAAAYCACLFSQLTARAPYTTPAAFAALSTALEQARSANDTAAVPSAVTQATKTCSSPAVGSGRPSGI
jgi:hypothetical protein